MKAIGSLFLFLLSFSTASASQDLHDVPLADLLREVQFSRARLSGN